ncbi:hypothetical protein [Endozoicomonas numazuensis]|uniref:hypothetical protein n=1 Tax=Endozoicomonas numazuensis TaxID=1137799 RepID=UPI0012679D0C|nr:hypothetical protein [Endozoicomonas numazuensis]
MFKNAWMLLLAGLFTLEALAGRFYPSAGVAWILPGNHEAPEQSEWLKRFPTGESVKIWEQQRADLVLGAGEGESNGPYSLGYMYNQKLEFSPTDLEMYLRARTESRRESYESLFLHFSEDTDLLIEDPADGSKTPFGRIPSIVGWTVQPDHAGFLIYQKPPYDKPVWKHSATGGGLYVYLFEKFDQLELDLSSVSGSGELVVEYPSSMSGGLVSGWSQMVVKDGTDNLRRSGVISWTPPADWKRAATHDGSGKTYGGGPYFGKRMLINEGRYYLVRLLWKEGTGTPPRLANIRVKDWMPEVYSVPVSSINSNYKAFNPKGQQVSVRRIPGWDPANDLNGDGYIDDVEFGQRSNAFASARFEWESRVVPLGKMWSSRSSWIRPNLQNPLLADLLGDYYKQSWGELKLNGAYNDDLFRLLNNEFFPHSGGRLREMPHTVNSPQAQALYQESFIKTLETIRINSGSFIGANISMVNLWSAEGASAFIPSFSIFLREGLIRPSLGFSGWFGLSKAWDTFALSRQDRWSILAAMINEGGRVHRLGNTRENWEKDIESSLAQYYLLNVPGKTYLHVWNRIFSYGSKNTRSTNYYQAGIPKNMAYLPEAMLSVDIGVPVSTLPGNREPVAYMAKNEVTDYAIVGYSNQTQLVSNYFPGGLLDIEPSNLFYLQRSSREIVPGGPAEMILAREYSKGLVLYRTDFFGHNAEFQQSYSSVVQLPGLYRRVYFDGRLGEPVSSISMAGYEGAVLLKAQ